MPPPGDYNETRDVPILISSVSSTNRTDLHMAIYSVEVTVSVNGSAPESDDWLLPFDGVCGKAMDIDDMILDWKNRNGDKKKRDSGPDDYGDPTGRVLTRFNHPSPEASARLWPHLPPSPLCLSGFAPCYVSPPQRIFATFHPLDPR